MSDDQKNRKTSHQDSHPQTVTGEGMQEFVVERVHRYFWIDDFNCARTTLLILAEWFRVDLHHQILAAAIGMHGGGGYRGQCGLVEGALLFLGILGEEMEVAEEKRVEACYDFAQRFESSFSSLRCSRLRPGGFQDNDPPHLCEPLACKTITLALDFVAERAASWGDQEGFRG